MLIAYQSFKDNLVLIKIPLMTFEEIFYQEMYFIYAGRMWSIAGSRPGKVKSKTMQSIFATSLLSMQD